MKFSKGDIIEHVKHGKPEFENTVRFLIINTDRVKGYELMVLNDPTLGGKSLWMFTEAVEKEHIKNIKLSRNERLRQILTTQ